MDLKTFIKESLTQIDEALNETSKKFEKYNYKFWKNSWWNKTIDFDIQVYASEWTDTNWQIWINVAWIKVWANWESTKTNYELSKISFSIIRENTLEQELIEITERKKQNKVYSPEIWI